MGTGWSVIGVFITPLSRMVRYAVRLVRGLLGHCLDSKLRVFARSMAHTVRRYMPGERAGTVPGTQCDIHQKDA